MSGSEDRSQEKSTDTFSLLPTGTPLPDMEQITSVAVVPFTDAGNIVGAVLSHRGLDIPGGHTEEDDKIPEDTVRRETLEEICATLSDNLKLVGVIQSSRIRNGKTTYMVVMAGTVRELLPLKFAPDEKSIGRKEVSPEDFITSHKGFLFMPEIIGRACQVYHSLVTPPVRVAFVGAGVHAVRAHAKHLKNISGAQIVGVFDPSDNSVKGLKEELGQDISPQRYENYEALLADPTVDAVIIGSPNRFHLPQLSAAVAAGKHVFCEKPMCSDVAEMEMLKNVLEEAKTAGLVVTSCHPRRFDPPYVWIKDHLSELTQKYGKPLELKLDFQYHKPDPTRSGLHGGSMLQDHMNHEFDYLNFLFGVEACTAHKLLDTEDRYHVAGTRDDGIVFSFGGTRRLDSPTYAETIEVRFEKATLHVDTYNSVNSYVHVHENPQNMLQPIGVGKTDYDLRFAGINNDWISAIRVGSPNYLTEAVMLANSHMSVEFANRQTVRYEPAPV